MVNWFSRRNKRVVAPTLRPRSDEQSSTKVDLHDLTPEPAVFLGQAAYLQLMLFENLSRVVANAPTTEAKANVSKVAALSLERHHALTAEIEREGLDVADAMEPYTKRIDAFQRVTTGADWTENMVTCYITAGFLNDFVARLALGLPSSLAHRLAPVLAVDTGESVLAAEIEAAIEANPRLGSRLALWGRRLLGDTMLIARSALRETPDPSATDDRIDPVFTELIAAHTRRMDAVGLTA